MYIPASFCSSGKTCSEAKDVKSTSWLVWVIPWRCVWPLDAKEVTKYRTVSLSLQFCHGLSTYFLSITLKRIKCIITTEWQSFLQSIFQLDFSFPIYFLRFLSHKCLFAWGGGQLAHSKTTNFWWSMAVYCQFRKIYKNIHVGGGICTHIHTIYLV